MKKTLTFLVFGIAGLAVMAITACNSSATNAPATVSVTGVSLSMPSGLMLVGHTLQLVETISPSDATTQTVTWSSSNTAVATVSSSGLVTAVSPGSTTITVTTTNGSKTATSAVTVAVTVFTLAGSGAPGNANGVSTAASFNSPEGVAVDSAGNVYVIDNGNNAVRRILTNGLVQTLAIGFNSPSGIALDSSGNVFIADTSNNKIEEITAASISSGNPAVTTFAGTGAPGSLNGAAAAATFTGPTGVVVDSSGNVYVADQGDDLIRKISAGTVSTLAGTAGVAGFVNATGVAAQFNTPSGVAVDSSGNVYVADSHNNMIRMVTPAGVVTTVNGIFLGQGSANGLFASFNWPFGIAIDSSGNLYVADTYNSMIRKISGGLVTTLAGTGGVTGATNGASTYASFILPKGVAVDSAGNVYVGDTGNDMIRVIE